MIVNNREEKCQMELFHQEKQCFKFYLEARYATDVIFQQCNRPIGTICETTKYFSRKHHFYGFKTKVSVLSNGIAISCGANYSGSESDVSMFWKRLNWHRFHTEINGQNASSDNG